jgi:hypothetical protein
MGISAYFNESTSYGLAMVNVQAMITG